MVVCSMNVEAVAIRNLFDLFLNEDITFYTSNFCFCCIFYRLRCAMLLSATTLTQWDLTSAYNWGIKTSTVDRDITSCLFSLYIGKSGW